MAYSGCSDGDFDEPDVLISPSPDKILDKITQTAASTTDLTPRVAAAGYALTPSATSGTVLTPGAAPTGSDLWPRSASGTDLTPRAASGIEVAPRARHGQRTLALTPDKQPRAFALRLHGRLVPPLEGLSCCRQMCRTTKERHAACTADPTLPDLGG